MEIKKYNTALTTLDKLLPVRMGETMIYTRVDLVMHLLACKKGIRTTFEPVSYVKGHFVPRKGTEVVDYLPIDE